MQNATSILNNQQGSVIIVTVIILALITMIGINGSSSSTAELQISTNAILHHTAFYTVESGIAAGRVMLNNIKMADVTSWDKLLNNSTDPPPDPLEVVVWNGTDCTSLNDLLDAAGGRTVGPATFFTLAIEDNDDLDGEWRVDTDDTIILTSTLAAPYRNANADITTTVQGGGTAYAQEHYNESSSGEAAVESETVSVSVRW